MGEPLDLEAGRGFCLDGRQTVEHEQHRSAGPHFRGEECRQLSQPLLILIEGLVGADIGHAVGNQGLIEEPHRSEMRHHAAMVLAKHGDKESAAALRGMAVDDLARQHGLARPGRSLNQVNPAAQKTAAEDRVEAWNMAWNPLDLGVSISSGINLMLCHARPIPVREP